MAYGRPDLGGMMLLEDDLIFERRDDHALVTSLFNYTLPLIRYRMNDALVPIEAGSAEPYRLLRDVIGRLEHISHFRNRSGDEDFISPQLINEFFVPGLRRFQLRQIDATSCRFCVCLDEGLAAPERARTLDLTRARLGAIFAEKEMDHVRFEVIEVDGLPIDPVTGKFRLVVPPDRQASVP